MSRKNFKVKSGLNVSSGLIIDSDVTIKGNLSVQNINNTIPYTSLDFDSDFASKNVLDSADVTAIAQASGGVDSNAIMGMIDSDFSTRTTSELTEGTNLYYTDARFDSVLGTKSTDDVTEGSSNKYYSSTLFNADLATKSTSDVSEGTNLYYTQVRVDSDFDARLATKSTANLSEGSNLYYTDARFDSALGTKSTTDLSEGANLYYTQLRADSDARNAISVGTNSVTFGSGISYNPVNGQVSFTGPDSAGIRTVFNGGYGVNIVGGQINVDSSLTLDLVDVDYADIHKKITFRDDSHGGPLVGEIYANHNDGFLFEAIGTPDAVFVVHLIDSELGTPVSYINISTTNGLSVENNRITNVAAPTASGDAANKSYVDAIAQGIHAHEATRVATTTTLAIHSGGTVTYNNGTAGVGAFLAFTAGTLDSVDGVALITDDRVLVKNETNAAHNGIYVWDSATRLTRATDLDEPVELLGGDFFFNTEGTVNAQNGYVISTGITSFGDSDINFIQFSGAGQIDAGDGLSKTGNTLSVNVGSGLTITSDTIKIPTNGIDDTMIDWGTGTNQVNTDDVPEGTTNKYYSDAQVDAHLSGGTGITYTSGAISITNTIGADSSVGSTSKIPVINVNAQGQITSLAEASIAGIISIGFNTSTGALTVNASDAQAYTTNITLQPFTTDGLSEGTNNLYYQTTYADSDFDVRFPSSFDARLTSTSIFDTRFDTRLTSTSIFNTRFDSAFNSSFPNKSTSDLSEGTNLYYTTARFDSDFNVKIAETLVSGIITMWSGSSASIPSGWYLCDGTNSTPDLRDKFVVGAGSTYAVGDTGGQNAITDVPAHTHNLSGNTSSAGAHTHTGTTANIGNHTHSIICRQGANSIGYNSYGSPTNAASNSYVWFNMNTSAAGSHSHNFTTASGGAHSHTLSGTAASTGSASVDTRPPYYALCYIMKA